MHSKPHIEWKSKKLWDWILENPPEWAHQKIRHLSEDYPDNIDNDPDMPRYRDFVFLTEHANQNIEPGKVIGQWDHYAGQTWFEAVTNPQWKGGKMRLCLELADSNPQYYLDDLKGIQVTSYNGDHWYSQTSGNHRTIVAKFFLAMLAASTGEKRLLPNVSTLRYHVDHQCLQAFKRLEQLIRETGIAVEIRVCSESLGLNGKQEIKIRVRDYRWGEDLERFGWLSATEFQKFSDWIIKTEGVLPRSLKLKDAIGVVPGRKQHRLYYPDMSGEFLTPPSPFFLSLMGQRKESGSKEPRLEG